MKIRAEINNIKNKSTLESFLEKINKIGKSLRGRGGERLAKKKGGN